MSRLDELFDGLPEHLTVEQLGTVLGVSRQTAYSWLHKGHLPAYRVGGTWIIVKDEVKDHLRSQRNRPTGTDTD